jgi:hypothetical protein
MAETSYQPPKIRAIIIGIIGFVVLLAVLCSLSGVVKSVGAVLLFFPSRLGVVKQVLPDEILTVDMSTNPTTVMIFKAGRYAVYTDDYDLLMIADQLSQSHGAPWLNVKFQATGEKIPLANVSRGLLPYDTPFAKGRPVFTFEITSPGRYELMHPARKINIYLVPDYTTGKEKTIYMAYAAQILVLLIPVGILYYRYDRRRRARIQAVTQLKRTTADTFWSKEYHRAKGDQDKRE